MHDSRYPLKPSVYSSHAALLRRLPDPGRGRRVLDTGCGDGYLAGILARRGYSVVGLESPGLASPAFPAEVRLVEADLDEGLPQLPGRFDVVLCGDVLEHLRRPERFLGQLKEALAPGGFLLLSLPNSGNLYFRLVVLSGRFPHEDRGLFDRTHLHFYTWDGWNDLFHSTGYRLHYVESASIPVGERFPRWKNALPVRAAERLSYGFARLRKELFAYQFIAEARPVKS